ncbi:cytochrome b [Swingsia samuiensis]|uniref:Cytochrome b n=1 Tax=Swingsia samuiensis TaxID=1293412 RepID=A0A4Y6UHE1_9PROT|nr:cytochrome b [Swingsia samuiensis]QDH16993.1 cytochrome b [Swingsia samuiensis]
MSTQQTRVTPVTRYDAGAIVLHWAIALGILVLIGMGLIMDHAHLSPMKVFQLYQLHKSIGITVMLLVVIRIGWRLTHRAPQLPADMPPAERSAAHISHGLLYLFQILLPLSGWAMVSASVFAIPTVLYGHIPWPDLPILSTLPNKAPVEAALKVVHHWASWLLTGVITLHILAALRHQFIMHDHILGQMLPSSKRK